MLEWVRKKFKRVEVKHEAMPNVQRRVNESWGRIDSFPSLSLSPSLFAQGIEREKSFAALVLHRWAKRRSNIRRHPLSAVVYHCVRGGICENEPLFAFSSLSDYLESVEKVNRGLYSKAKFTFIVRICTG